MVEKAKPRKVVWLCYSCGNCIDQMTITNETEFFMMNKLNKQRKGPSCRCGDISSLHYDVNDFAVEYASMMNEEFDFSEEKVFPDEFRESHL